MSKNPSVMNHQFSKVPSAEIPRASFDRSHGNKCTFDSGYLVPIFVDEALPGDTFNLRATMFARLATPLFPFMDNMFLDTFYFFVPNRLLWDNWQKFNGEQDNPGDSTDFLIPTMTTTSVEGSISDYFGIPTDIELTHSALWHRAYNLIYNEWFRDENLQDSVIANRGDGPDDPLDYSILRRGKRHDYFTSALPWPQKGPAVTLPLGQSAPITTDAAATENLTVNATYDGLNHGLLTNTDNLQLQAANGDVTKILYADLSEATAATINQLRQAFQIQKLYERDARGGTRYTEVIRAHFGVTSPDARLQRPEYLGGNSTALNVNTVQQTAPDALDPTGSSVGDLSAYATATSQGGFTKSFTEHGVIIGLISARADLTYQQGLNKMWSRSTRFDFYWPALSHIGEQAVLNKEIYADGTATDEDVFGYQERYAEYRYKPSTICGQFRSNFAQTLDSWHLAQDFANLPVLNSEFIEENPPVDRVIVVPTEPQFIMDSYFKLKCARPMPIYSVPGLIDHF